MTRSGGASRRERQRSPAIARRFPSRNPALSRKCAISAAMSASSSTMRTDGSIVCRADCPTERVVIRVHRCTKVASRGYGHRPVSAETDIRWAGLRSASRIRFSTPIAGAYLRPFPGRPSVVPHRRAAAAAARRRWRHRRGAVTSWAGCQWLFWATLALGLVMSGISVVGWSVDELLLGVGTSWLGWHAVFALFGGVAPLLALLAQPHRGVREKVTATTAVDIAGIAVLTGFLYSHFACRPESGSPCQGASAVAPAALRAAAVSRVRRAWSSPRSSPPIRDGSATYRRLAIGLSIQLHHADARQRRNLAGLLSERVAWRRDVDSAVRVLPVGRVRRAAIRRSLRSRRTRQLRRPRGPWVIFGGLALLPVIDYGLRLRGSAAGALGSFQDLSMAVAIVSVLPLLMARLAVERAELRQVDAKLRLMGAAVEEANELIVIVSSDGQIRHANRAFCECRGLHAARPARQAARAGDRRRVAVASSTN